jgi:mono/diheme cytochrome c family protein
MRNRNLVFILAAISIVTLFMLASQNSTHKSAAATEGATMAATAEEGGAACEALRTVPKVVATAEPGGTPAAEVEIARPSNPGGPGEALKLVGDPKAGEKVFADNCQKCHGEQGQGGIKNEGSDDGTIPELNPIDETIVDNDPKVFACNIDLFVEHGSVPAGPSPKETMAPWGDQQQLTSQQIADVIAYVISLNGGSSAQATAAPTAAK